MLDNFNLQYRTIYLRIENKIYKSILHMNIKLKLMYCF